MGALEQCFGPAVLLVGSKGEIYPTLHCAGSFVSIGLVTSLRDRLTAASTHEHCVQACSELVEREVAARKGFGGAALKTAVGVLKKVRPDLVPHAMSRLIPHFAEVLEPWWSKSGEDAAAFALALNAEQGAVADALLSVTDGKIDGAHDSLKKVYAKLRSGAKSQVEQSVPAIAQTLAEVLDKG